jgi:hypothetical protein
MKAESESGLQKACVQLLVARNWLVLRFNPGRSQRGGQWVQPCPEGMSDLVIARDGVVAFLEMKTPKGRLRPTQRDFSDRLRRAGCNYFVCRSVAELQTFLDELDS